jgi:hypothetical protein
VSSHLNSEVSCSTALVQTLLMATWDVIRAAAYLNEHANEHSLGRCAEYVRKAIEVGGLHLIHHCSAKEYGNSLERDCFATQANASDLPQKFHPEAT